MTPATARTVANVIVGAGVVALGIVILRTPRLRRLAWTLTKTAATTTVPAYLAKEVTTAWRASAP
jgi:hypothetical protein